MMLKFLKDKFTAGNDFYESSSMMIISRKIL